jgi:hypothetical protein
MVRVLRKHASRTGQKHDASAGAERSPTDAVAMRLYDHDYGTETPSVPDFPQLEKRQS